jgi:hypothetical protein
MRETVTAMMADVPDAIKSKRIANNTVRYERANGDIVWRLHRTDVVTKHPDGTWTLNSGGWKTLTTKDRISTYAPCNLYSDRGTWYVSGNGERVAFYDGIKLNENGRPLDTGKSDKLAKQADSLRKQIAKFCKLIDTRETLPYPDNGDCWHCLMFQAEKPNDGRRSIEFNSIPGQSGPSTDTEHLLSHIKEGYLHGSLLVNAMRWAGYNDTGISMYYHGANERHEKYAREAFKRALRRYLGRKLGLVV